MIRTKAVFFHHLFFSRTILFTRTALGTCKTRLRHGEPRIIHNKPTSTKYQRQNISHRMYIKVDAFFCYRVFYVIVGGETIYFHDMRKRKP